MTLTKTASFIYDLWGSQLAMMRGIWTGAYPPEDSPQPRPLLIERIVMTVLVFLRLVSLSRFTNVPRTDRARSLWTEVYVLAWLGILVLLLFQHRSIGTTATTIIVTYRLVDGLGFRLSVLFVDRYNPSWGVHSLNRTLLLLLLNYLELAVGFAALYLTTTSVAFEGEAIAIANSGLAMYFSIVTLSTLGYGDIAPFTDVGRLLAPLEALAGFMLVVVVIGAFLTGLRDIRSLKQSSGRSEKERGGRSES